MKIQDIHYFYIYICLYSHYNAEEQAITYLFTLTLKF